MMDIDFANPFVLIIGGILFLALLYFWNKRNSNTQSQRRHRSFRDNYYKRREDREKNNED